MPVDHNPESITIINYTFLYHLWTVLRYNDMCHIHFTEMATALIRLIWASHYQPTNFTLCTNNTIMFYILACGMGWALCGSPGDRLVVKLGKQQIWIETMALFGGCPLPVTWLIQWTVTYTLLIHELPCFQGKRGVTLGLYGEEAPAKVLPCVIS